MISEFILTLVAAAALLGPSAPAAGSTPAAGSISGVVSNASRDGAPVAGADVVLRVRLEGQFVTAAEGAADEQGRFVFGNIPADPDYIYLPGANLDGIHYPGPRVRLNAETPHARLKLLVHDTVARPSPLVARRHEITLQPETDTVRVTERLLIENPTTRTYVGRPARAGGRAATLRLSVPPDFRRTTFHREFYGRQFTLIDGRLVTDIPWTPGQRELAFTYVLPNEDRHRVWERPLDLPCERVRITIHTDTPNEVTCNLPRAASQATGAVTFESTGQTLPAGHTIRLQLGRLPISLAAYSRWLALAVLVLLIAGTILIGSWRQKWTQSQMRKRRPPGRERKAA